MVLEFQFFSVKSILVHMSLHDCIYCVIAKLLTNFIPKL